MPGRTMHRCLVGILSVGVLGIVPPTPGIAQPYDLLLAGGHVIDPKNGIDDVMDTNLWGRGLGHWRAAREDLAVRRACRCIKGPDRMGQLEV